MRQCKVVCVCAVVVAEDQLSCCGCYAVAHIVAVLAVLAPNKKFVCMSECLSVWGLAVGGVCY
jgi:hypothetical protein